MTIEPYINQDSPLLPRTDITTLLFDIRAETSLFDVAETRRNIELHAKVSPPGTRILCLISSETSAQPIYGPVTPVLYDVDDGDAAHFSHLTALQGVLLVHIYGDAPQGKKRRLPELLGAIAARHSSGQPMPQIMVVADDVGMRDSAGKEDRSEIVTACSDFGACSLHFIHAAGVANGDAGSDQNLIRMLQLASCYSDLRIAKLEQDVRAASSAFRDAAEQLGELRKRLLIEQRLAARRDNANSKDERAAKRYWSRGYWKKRKEKLLRSIQKRFVNSY